MCAKWCAPLHRGFHDDLSQDGGVAEMMELDAGNPRVGNGCSQWN